MEVPTFKIIKPGPFTTIQRLSEQANEGKRIPASDAFDRFAFKMGNLILRNPLGDPGIEITGEGAEIQTMKETAIAVTGGSFDVRLNGEQIEQWCAVNISKGDTLSIGVSKSGWRCYVCVAGGVRKRHTPGKKSIRTKEGNAEFGNPLRKGDILTTETSGVLLSELMGRRVKQTVLPKLEGEPELRIVLTAQYDHLRDESKEVLLNSSYSISPDSNRVCYRFEGPQLLFKEKTYLGGEYGRAAGALNDEDTAGLIQVSADGEVTCTGPDFVAESGRIPIARLIAPDMSRVAQLRPKDHLKFKVVTQDDARLISHHFISLIAETNIIRSPTSKEIDRWGH